METVLHYLSCAKYEIEKEPPNIKFPSTHLKNALVDIKSLEISNNPRYIHHKRRKISKINKDPSNREISSLESSDMTSEDEINVNPVSIKLKRNSKEKKQEDLKKNNGLDSIIPDFIGHLPRWGGFFVINGKKIEVINTCTIDNYLFGFWILYKIMPNFVERIPKPEQSEFIKEIIHKIDDYQWDNARKIWYLNIMKKKISNKRKINFYGTVEDFFIKFMYEFQKHSLILSCSNNCKLNKKEIISEQADIIQIGKSKDKGIGIVTDLSYKCRICNLRVSCDVIFKYNTIFFFIETTSHLKINELPKIIKIQNKTYKLLNAIFHLEKQKHFVSVFDIDNNKYLIDDLSHEAPLLSEGTGMHKINYVDLFIYSAMYFQII